MCQRIKQLINPAFLVLFFVFIVLINFPFPLFHLIKHQEDKRKHTGCTEDKGSCVTDWSAGPNLMNYILKQTKKTTVNNYGANNY